MRRTIASSLAATLLTAIATPSLPARAASVDTGVLTCNVDSGWGFVVGSSRNIRCVYSPSPGVTEHYSGTLDKFGADIGYLENAVIVWAVVAPSLGSAPGALSGVYGGATGSATVGIGGGVNVLIGGSTKSIELQPVSVEGTQGIDVAAGIESLSLHYQS